MKKRKLAGKLYGMASTVLHPLVRIRPPQLFRPSIFAHFLFAEANELLPGDGDTRAVLPITLTRCE